MQVKVAVEFRKRLSLKDERLKVISR